MARTDNLNNFLTDVADAIREKKGTTDTIPASSFDEEIKNLPSGGSGGGSADVSEYLETHVTSSTASYFTSRNMLKKVPNLTVDASVSALTYFFYQQMELTEVPYIDTSKVTAMQYMFSGCKKLKNIPNYNTSNVKNMSYMFQSTAITDMPNLDTRNVTNMGNMFRECDGIINFTGIDAQSCTIMNYMFYYARNMKTVENIINTSKVTDMSYMFSMCAGLENLCELDAQSVINVSSMFQGLKENFTTFGGLKDLGKAYTTSSAENYNRYVLDLSTCPSLTVESLINVLNKLYDIATKGCKKQKVNLGSDNLTKLQATEEGLQAIANAEAKGWTVV